MIGSLEKKNQQKIDFSMLQKVGGGMSIWEVLTTNFLL